MTATAWRQLALIVSVAGLVMCHKVSGSDSKAAPAPDAAAAADARPAESGTAPARPPAPKPAERPSPGACAQLRRSVEKQLAAAQRCSSDSECVPITFEYAFRPCGDSARTGASLDKAAADAKDYVDRCKPVVHPVKCAHRITPVCKRGRCALTTPPGA